jgi:hypothetical protein
MSYTSEDLNAWFWDMLGLGFGGKKYLKRKDRNGNRVQSKSYTKYLSKSDSELKAFRKRKARRVYAKEDRAMLSNRKYARDNVREGIGLFMVARKEKGLGSYGNEKHVVYQKFKEIQAANFAELSDISGAQKKLKTRDSKGRFLSG